MNGKRSRHVSFAGRKRQTRVVTSAGGLRRCGGARDRDMRPAGVRHAKHKYPIPSQEADNALVTFHTGFRVSVGGGDHLASEGSSACLRLCYRK
ncbi:hypothetical protein EVAR_46015_1 [Eumeta japonica]|uniref:Uncharacterized protein n=1 Tax=Eumeta variegata TaxID=151549 RepID=A0A4C1Z663_EUMVA|nr:hypothetical protein EVAR_46015_1 [Eumeta japonica]